MQLSVRSLSRTVNFKHRFNHKDQAHFLMPRKTRNLLIDKKFKKTDIEYPFEHGEVINYTLDGVSIHPVTKVTGALPNSVVGE